MQGHILCNTSSNVCHSVSYRVTSVFWPNITYWNKGDTCFSEIYYVHGFLFFFYFFSLNSSLYFTYLNVIRRLIYLPSSDVLVRGDYDLIKSSFVKTKTKTYLCWQFCVFWSTHFIRMMVLDHSDEVCWPEHTKLSTQVSFCFGFDK